MATANQEVAALPQYFTKTGPSGPVPCKILVVGEAPGANEEVQKIPFVGASGDEWDRMLNEAGYIQGLNSQELRRARDKTIFLTNVCKYRPPENKIEYFFLDKVLKKPNEFILEGVRELHQEIAQVKPELILCLGNLPTWALMRQCQGAAKGLITKWRGSMLFHEYTDSEGVQRKALLMPTYHPAYIMRAWEYRAIVIHDLRRAREGLERREWPPRPISYIVRPSFTDAMDCLGDLRRRADERPEEDPLLITSDIETRSGYIACHGIAWNTSEAICIPRMSVARPTGYWTLDEDVALWARERDLLTHPKVSVIGQSYLYDAQYFARRCGYVPNLRHDTRFMQHVAWPGLPQTLDFMSSMYSEHYVYWKDDGKEWDPKIHSEEQHWRYNCDDATRTMEVYLALDRILRKLDLYEQYKFQMRLWRPMLDLMLRGVRIDTMLLGKIAQELISAMQDRQAQLNKILGYEINIDSPKQIHDLFYNQLRCQIVKDRKTKRPTCDDDALDLFKIREPLLRPIVTLIQDIRGLRTMMSNVILAKRDTDGRLRSQFEPLTETLRWSSKKNAWGGGCNLQNWTKGDEDKVESERSGYPIPNVRKLVVPDPGREIASIDLSGADAQTVAWDADDEDLKAAFRAGIKIHAHNAKTMYGGRAPTGFEQPYYDRMRTGVHLINYVGGDDTLAAALGIPRWEAAAIRAQWFQLHPKIKDWHDRIQDELGRSRSVRNKFGYRRFYFERVEGLLPEAVAWIGQSQTACVTNRAFVALAEDALLRSLEFELLIQVHDELVFQYPIFNRTRVLRRVHSLAHITVPYPDPLIIPWGLKISQKSWGECEKYDWPLQVQDAKQTILQ